MNTNFSSNDSSTRVDSSSISPKFLKMENTESMMTDPILMSVSRLFPSDTERMLSAEFLTRRSLFRPSKSSGLCGHRSVRSKKVSERKMVQSSSHDRLDQEKRQHSTPCSRASIPMSARLSHSKIR